MKFLHENISTFLWIITAAVFTLLFSKKYPGALPKIKNLLKLSISAFLTKSNVSLLLLLYNLLWVAVRKFNLPLFRQIEILSPLFPVTLILGAIMGLRGALETTKAEKPQKGFAFGFIGFLGNTILILYGLIQIFIALPSLGAH